MKKKREISIVESKWKYKVDELKIDKGGQNLGNVSSIQNLENYTNYYSPLIFALNVKQDVYKIALF